MKHLILTFFAVILCYSLFFDNKSATTAADEINYVHENVSPPIYPIVFPDTMQFITAHNVGLNFIQSY
jgi:hypothetical protein